VLTALLVGAIRLFGSFGSGSGSGSGGGGTTLAAWRSALSAALLLAFLWYTGAQACSRLECRLPLCRW
jgi:hypothetical protein